MWPFGKKHKFPGIKENSDGTIDFTLTEEEAQEADRTLQGYKGILIHPDFAERYRNGAMAVALSNYAIWLVNLAHIEIPESETRRQWPAIQATLEKSIAAVWKSYMMCPLPIFLYHRASFHNTLGNGEQARDLFAAFVREQSKFKADDLMNRLIAWEGTDVERALAHARKNL